MRLVGGQARRNRC